MAQNNTQTSEHQDLITNYMYLGLLPFFAGALGPWILASHESWFTNAFMLYSTIILAFLSGAIWAIVLFTSNPLAERHIHTAIVLSLVPLAAYFLPDIYRASLLLVGFLALLFWEKLFLKELYSSWYQELRHRISFIAVACHMLVIWNIIHTT